MLRRSDKFGGARLWMALSGTRRVLKSDPSSDHGSVILVVRLTVHPPPPSCIINMGGDKHGATHPHHRLHFPHTTSAEMSYM